MKRKATQRQTTPAAPKMTKEQFLIEWVLIRASFRVEFSEAAAVGAANEAWEEIQRLKDL